MFRVNVSTRIHFIPCCQYVVVYSLHLFYFSRNTINICLWTTSAIEFLVSWRSRMGSSCPLLSSPTGNDPAFPKLTFLARSHAGGLGASFGSAITESLLPEKAIRLSRNTVPPGSNCYRLRHGKGFPAWKPFTLQRTSFRQKAGCVFVNILWTSCHRLPFVAATFFLFLWHRSSGITTYQWWHWRYH